jgi:hypothetical protein
VPVLLGLPASRAAEGLHGWRGTPAAAAAALHAPEGRTWVRPEAERPQRFDAEAVVVSNCC